MSFFCIFKVKIMNKKIENNILAVRLYTGENVIANLNEAVKSTGKSLGIILNGAGMMKEVKIGYFMGKGEYKENIFKTPREIVSLTGNFVNSPEGFFTHLHVSLADDSGEVVGGHLQEASVYGTGEIFIYLSDMQVTRKIDEETGLAGLRL